MLRLILLKIKNKRIMTACLVLGLALLTAAISCQPMYKNGALNRVLRSGFDSYIETNNKYPTVMTRDEIYTINDSLSLDDVQNEYAKTKDVVSENLDFIGMTSSQSIISTEKTFRGQKGYINDNQVEFFDDNYKNSSSLNLSYMLGMAEHCSIYDYSDIDGTDDYYKCVVGKNAMESYALYPGVVLRFPDLKADDGSELMLVVSGVFDRKDSADLFFYEIPSDFAKDVFLSKEDYCEIIKKYGIDSIRFREHYLFDYDKICAQNIDDVKCYVDEINKNMALEETFTYHLDNYYLSKKSIDITLWVMELPLLTMILAFIYMVSSQIVGSEIAEIATQKSRGMSKWQVILLYFYQSLILGLAGLILGVPLGIVMCKTAGAATDFLTFDFSNRAMYTFTSESFLYAAIAYVIGIVCIIIPVMASAKVSIVQAKSAYKYGAKTIWEKCFLDVILLALSLYLLYNFMQSIDITRQNALLGEMADPLVFVDTCLFLVAAGMVFLRIARIVINLIYKAGRKHWGTCAYTAFLQTSRNFSRQALISIFLVLTIAMGIFYSNTARTINENKIERIEYNVGCDMKASETWRIVTFKSEDEQKYRYEEKEYGRFVGLVDEGLCESITKVITNNTTIAAKGRKNVPDCLVYGINTKEFGQTATLRDGLNGNTHWFNYLNALADAPDGVIISRNLAEALHAKEGDAITLNRMGEYELYEEQSRGILGVIVCGIVDDFPGYERYYYVEEAGEGGLVRTEKERYLVVMNFSSSVYAYEISPYDVWMKFAPGTDADDIDEYFDRAGIDATNKVCKDREITKMKESLDIQIINGMFTLGFVVALLVCAAGFLIYWITSIRQRELQFGVYRAMGMSVGEINRMLFYEHLLSTLFSIVSGLAEGVIATLLFEKLFSIVYLPQKHNLDIYMNYDASDYFRLGAVILAMVIACIFVLKQQTGKLNISDALKLGEE